MSSELGIEMKLIFLRTLYGAVVGAVLSLLSLLGVVYESLRFVGIPSWLIPYMGWIYLAILYVPTIPIAKRLGARRKFDKYLRGASTYVAASILVHVVVTAL